MVLKRARRGGGAFEIPVFRGRGVVMKPKFKATKESKGGGEGREVLFELGAREKESLFSAIDRGKCGEIFFYIRTGRVRARWKENINEW